MATSPNYNDPDFQRFLQQMKIIGMTESANNYNAKNPAPGQTATGKYQYNSTHLDNIKKFSRQIGMPVNSLEEFRQNPGLQEAYFQYDQYKGYQWAKNKLVSENPFNYNTAELAALRHFQGEKGANDILVKGKHKGSDKIGNPSTKEYIEKRFRPALKSAGLYTVSGREKNDAKANSSDDKTKQKIQSDYFAELKKIKSQKLGNIVENSMINQLNQKYFDAGNLEIVNRKIDYRNNNADDEVNQDFATKKKLADTFLSGVSQEGGTITDLKYAGNKNSFDDLAKIAKTFKESPQLVLMQSKGPWYDARDYYRIDPTTKTGQFLLNPTVETLKKQRPEPEKYSRIGLDQYERVVDIAEDDEEFEDVPAEDLTATPTATSPALTNPAQPAITATPEPAPTTYSNIEVMSMLDGGMVPDEQFQYKAGFPNLPYEAVGYLMAGLEGVKAGNTEIPMRDEQVSPLLRNYAAEWMKISKMGLPPEIEADLKNKQAAAYQVGLTNIVRASGGNRNLVLGNQGQLDLARMQGITEIALLDIDRRDKALEKYGEVIQYIESFNANRDIANNERLYREAEKKQMAGSQLAAQGFGSLIDSLKYAKENAPGSPNDMMRQYLMYSISGVNPGIDDDGSGTQPGTQSFVDAQRVVQKNQKSERDKIKSFYKTQSKEDKEKFNTFLFENDHLRPDVNKDVTFDEMKSQFDAYTGAVQGMKSAADAQGVIADAGAGVISLTDDQVANPEKYTTMEPMPILNAYGPQVPPATPQTFTPAMMNAGLTSVVPEDSRTIAERYRKVIEESEEYLSGQNKVANTSLDNLIKTTEEDTNRMTTQLNRIN